MSESAAVKESRRVLRLIRDHLADAHHNLGAQRETVGLVEVIHHPENRIPYLNYVAPRRNTAWVPGPQLEAGLDHLREYGRLPRVYYVEGLYPPIFAKALRDIGLTVESETALMAYKVDAQNLPEKPTMPTGMRVDFPDTQEGVALWWYVWRNAHFDVITHGTEPLFIGRDLREITLGHQVDLLLYRYNFPVGVARITFHGTTAHLSAFALMKEIRTPQNLRVLYQLAMHRAATCNAELIFTSGADETGQTVSRDLGFVDSGSIVCYAETPVTDQQEVDDIHVAEPIFILR